MTVAADLPDPNRSLRNWLATSSEKLTGEQMAKLFSKMIDGEINAKTLSEFFKFAPSVALPIAQYLNSVPAQKEALTKKQAENLAANRSLYDAHMAALKSLLEKAQDEETLRKIAEQMTEAARLAHDSMNKINENAISEQSGLNKGALAAIGSLIAFGLGVLALTK